MEPAEEELCSLYVVSTEAVRSGPRPAADSASSDVFWEGSAFTEKYRKIHVHWSVLR